MAVLSRQKHKSFLHKQQGQELAKLDLLESQFFPYQLWYQLDSLYQLRSQSFQTAHKHKYRRVKVNLT